MSKAARMAINWVEQGLVPDTVIRQAIRRLLARRLEAIGASDCAVGAEVEDAVVREMDGSPIAPVPELANAQHYELPAAFFDQVLGPAPQVQRLLLAGTALRPGRGRGRSPAH